MKESSDKVIKEIIFRERLEKTPFDDLIKPFKKNWAWLTDKSNLISIDDYFGKGIGTKGSYELLSALDRDLFHDNKEDFKGVYVFFSECKPFYVGISQNVISRIQQHVKVKSHFSASIAFNIGKELPLKEGCDKSIKDRNYLQNYIDWGCVHLYLLKQQINFMPIDSDDELALFEMYCAIEGGMAMNTFKTH